MSMHGRSVAACRIRSLQIKTKSVEIFSVLGVSKKVWVFDLYNVKTIPAMAFKPTFYNIKKRLT